jgi:hypothetical protein
MDVVDHFNRRKETKAGLDAIGSAFLQVSVVKPLAVTHTVAALVKAKQRHDDQVKSFSRDDLGAFGFQDLPPAFPSKRASLIDMRFNFAGGNIDPWSSGNYARVRVPDSIEQDARFDLAEMSECDITVNRVYRTEIYL